MKIRSQFLSLLAIGSALFLSPPAKAAAPDQFFISYFTKMDTTRWYVADNFIDGSQMACQWAAASLQTNVGAKLAMTVTNKGGKFAPDACPQIHTRNFHGYGIYEIAMQTAAGSGLNTAFFSYVGPPYGNPVHDEVDFEFLGKSPTTVEVNYFANNQYVRGATAQLGFDASKAVHIYRYDWNKTYIAWSVDGRLLYRTPIGAPIPKNPGPLFVDLWAGSTMEDSWMGHFTYTKPVSAYVEWVRFTPYNY